MLDAAFWGLIQGLTEFLPISSSGHLVLVPAVLDREGPDLATSAVLHLGTLGAVLIYFRAEVGQMLRWTATGRRLLALLLIGTVPAVVIGVVFRSVFEEINDSPTTVSLFLVANGLMLLATGFLKRGSREIADTGNRDALSIGLGQALALIPGISRSGSTISAGLVLGFSRDAAARFAFLLGIPAIAGAGLSQLVELAASDETIGSDLWIGVAVAAGSGYLAIALLLWLIRKVGLVPFGVYSVIAGLFALSVV